MSNLEDDIRKVLTDEDASYDLDREEGVFRQMAGIYRGKLRWMAIFATIDAVVCVGLMVWAAIEFFRADDTKWQIFYATGILLLAMLLLLVKLWGWMLMNRHSLQREIKRLEWRLIDHDEQKRVRPQHERRST